MTHVSTTENTALAAAVQLTDAERLEAKRRRLLAA